MQKRLAPPKSPRNYLIRLLSRREWSEAELRAKLKERDVPEAAAEDALTFVKGHGLQSDIRFAASRTRALSSRKGDRAIAFDLKTKGVAPELIEQELNGLGTEPERVIPAVRRFEGMALDPALKAKIWRFLTARGFSSTAIKAAVQHLACEESASAGNSGGLGDED